MKKGILFSLAAACISGFSVYANGLFVTNSDPVVFALVRNMIVSIIMTLLFVFGIFKWKGKTYSKKDWLKLACIGAIGGGIPFALFFMGLSRIGAVNANIINKSLFLWVAVFALPLLHEHISKLQIAGYGILLFAVFLYGNTFRFVPSIGLVMVLSATMMWAMEHVLVKKVFSAHSHPSMLAWARIIFGLPWLMGLVFLGNKGTFIASTVSAAAIPLIVSSILLTLYISFWYRAIRFAPVTLVSSILVIAPVITLTVQSLAGGHTFTGIQLGQTGIMIIGIFLITYTYVRKSITYPGS